MVALSLGINGHTQAFIVTIIISLVLPSPGAGDPIVVYLFFFEKYLSAVRG